MRALLKDCSFSIDGMEDRLFFIFFALYFSILILFGINRPVWFDEEHYISTINYFGTTPFFQALYNYEEMSTPLPFILFSLWGKLFGFQLVTMRVLNIIVALVTYFFIYLLLSKNLNKNGALLLTIFIALNPYFAGASIFVFTDMTAVLFMVTAFLAVNYQNALALFLGLAGALLSRQYCAFLIPAFLVYFTMKLVLDRQNRVAIRSILAIVLSGVPLLMLFIYWHGTHPANKVSELYMNNAFVFHANAFVLYASQIVLYTLPFSVICNIGIYKKRMWSVISLFVSALYVFAPVKASPAAEEISRFTVGYLHRAIERPGIQWLSHGVFFSGFLLSIPILFSWLQILRHKVKDRNIDMELLFILTMFSFLLVMPFSYLLWEKYFIPVLPITLLIFMSKKRVVLRKFEA